MLINVLITDCVPPNNCKTTRNLLLGFRPYIFVHPLFFHFLFLDVYTIFRTLYAGTSACESYLLVVLKNEVDKTHRRRLDSKMYIILYLYVHYIKLYIRQTAGLLYCSANGKTVEKLCAHLRLYVDLS